MEQLDEESCCPCFYPDYCEVEKWTKHTWLNHPEEGSNKKRLQYCLDFRGHILYMRAIQGHSGENSRSVGAGQCGNPVHLD